MREHGFSKEKLMATATLTHPLVSATQPAQGAAIASLDGVTKRFGASLALDNLSLSLHPGEVVALLGPNGAGKTTAVRLLLGLTRPTSGSVRLFGRAADDTLARVRVGTMLQIARVPETLRVREHIQLFRSYYPAPLPLDEVLALAGITDIANRLFSTLSGGQKQRMLFALALCGNPDLVFLDEPTVGMDIEARRALWAQVRGLSARGKTILLTTHYLEEADALASRVVVINKGKIIAQGTSQEIKGLVAGRKVRVVTQLKVSELQSLPTVTSVTQDRDGVVLTATNSDQAVRALLLADSTAHSLEISGAALEDAFLQLTGS
jgi:ABC-2 type transport system ATP-binding protein